jgi:hypothetical protein
MDQYTLYKYCSTFLETLNEIISQHMSLELSDEAKLIFRNAGIFRHKNGDSFWTYLRNKWVHFVMLRFPMKLIKTSGKPRKVSCYGTGEEGQNET